MHYLLFILCCSHIIFGAQTQPVSYFFKKPEFNNTRIFHIQDTVGDAAHKTVSPAYFSLYLNAVTSLQHLCIKAIQNYQQEAETRDQTDPRILPPLITKQTLQSYKSLPLKLKQEFMRSIARQINCIPDQLNLQCIKRDMGLSHFFDLMHDQEIAILQCAVPITNATDGGVLFITLKQNKGTRTHDMLFYKKDNLAVGVMTIDDTLTPTMKALPYTDRQKTARSIARTYLADKKILQVVAFHLNNMYKHIKISAFGGVVHPNGKNKVQKKGPTAESSNHDFISDECTIC